MLWAVRLDQHACRKITDTGQHFLVGGREAEVEGAAGSLGHNDLAEDLEPFVNSSFGERNELV